MKTEQDDKTSAVEANGTLSVGTLVKFSHDIVSTDVNNEKERVQDVVEIGVGDFSLGRGVNKRPHTFAERWYSPISYILYFWFSGLLKTGYRRTLQYDDLFDTPDALKTKNVYPDFCDTFNGLVGDAVESGEKGQKFVEDAKKGVSARFVFRTILTRHWKRIAYAMGLQLCYSGVQFVGPLMLNEITKILTKAEADPDLPSSEITKAYLYAMGMFLAPLVGTLGASQANRVAIGTQIMIRSELIASIYRKALSLSTRSRQATETGRIVNFMSADVNQLQSFFYPFASQLLTGPVMLITALILLWFQIRWATFIGLGILLISTPATTIFLKKITGFRREMLKHTDQRVKLMNQLLVGIRVLKMYAWESAQEAAVLEVRKRELAALGKAIPYRVGLQTLLFAAPSLAMVTCFVVYGTVKPEQFTASSVFTSIALFALMRFPLIFLPFALIQLANALVSMRRLSIFYLQENRQENVENMDSIGIRIDDGDFVWRKPPKKLALPEVGKKKKGGKPKEEGEVKAAEKKIDDDDMIIEDGETDGSSDKGSPTSSDQPKSHMKDDDVAWTLKDINLTVHDGELVCVVGKVGCGKSSLVQAIIGEMERQSGQVSVGGRVAYASQQAWIVNARLKDNVTFGQEFDQTKWDAAVDACCLRQDLEVLPGGEDTEIGEKGINLSGGQKQRISLARAMYQDADVYIMDDPLSAVDVHVGRHIFENFIDGAIKSKARLLVTNQLTYLPQADKIVMLENGKILVQGTFEECQKCPAFQRLLSEHNARAGETQEEEKQETKAPKSVKKDITSKLIHSAIASAPADGNKLGSVKSGIVRTETFEKIKETPQTEVSGKKGITRFETMQRENRKPDQSGKLMIKEDQEVGQVTGKVYWNYIKAYGVLSFVGLICFWSSEQAVRILTNWYLSKWTQAEMNAAQTGSDFDRYSYVGGYLGFAFGFVALTSTRSLMNLLSALHASKVIHLKTLGSLVRAPVMFFDTTPVGRILNRFSKDTDDVDFLLSMSMTEFGNCIMQLLSTMIFLAVIQPILLAGIVPLMGIYYILQKYYRRSYIEMQRLDAVSRSPIYAHFSESLAGVETIRAYNLKSAFAISSDKKVDVNHRAYFTLKMANEWLAQRLDIIGATIVFLTAILAITRRDVVSVSLAALTLSEALDVTLFLKAAVTSGAMFETRFNSVERLSAYWDLTQEKPSEIEDNKPSDDWPYDGEIEFDDIWMRYRPDLDPVLKGVSFVVKPGDKVGIVGRTGSGKSSLIVTLFRLVEPYQGTITLDGINILDLGLNDVRSRIAAIPQDPVLFSGTVRTNLDPYDRHSDAEIWEALSHVSLKGVVAGLDSGLSSDVAENGDNFSVGQRQLLCVARALLRQPKVLVADEATASVDSETDSLIQKTIRREFKHCTVITIAHRINTILDSTKVLVMDGGVVAEYDSVPTLMGRSNSSFRAMVLESDAGTPGTSRASSTQNLAALDGEQNRPLPKGMNTFVNRMKDYGAK
jgi:ATP-binding cassette subfamily C (CFTR/MRP) protein 1